MEECIFCRIARGEIPCTKVYETDRVIAFDDIHPAAPVHVVVIPKEHIGTLMDATPEHGDVAKELMEAVRQIATIKGVDESGFRTVVNCGKNGGQVIFHLHAHVLGGRMLSDEMG